jgi:hypothetical protein
MTQPIYTNKMCGCNEYIALNNRHLTTNEARLEVDGEREMVAEAYALCRDYVTNLFGELIPEFLPNTHMEIVSYKPKHKQPTYRIAALSLQHVALTTKDARLKMFVKNERMSDPEKAPRAIQARKPRYNLVLQTYLHKVERWLFHRGFSKRVTTKGLDAYSKASFLKLAWDQFVDPVAILADHSRFDSRQHTLWLQSEHSFYQRFYPQDKLLKELLEMQLVNKGGSRNGVSYTVRGTRASGDANTSLGNSLTNIAILCYWLKSIRNKRIIVDGDDSVVLIERTDLHLSASRLQDMGFSTTYTVVDVFEEVEFCQCRPVQTMNGWLMVRTPQRLVERSTVCIQRNYNRPDLFMRWLHTVGKCELTNNRGVPVVSSFCRMLERSHDKPITITDDVTKRVIKYSPPDIISEQARLSFFRAFGFPIGRQLHWEKYFEAITLRGHNPELVDVMEPSPNTSILQLY